MPVIKGVPASPGVTIGRAFLLRRGRYPLLVKEKVVIVAENLTPSDTMRLRKDLVAAFVTDKGGVTSHTAIVARSLRIPAVVGTKNATKVIKDNDIVIVDGVKGLVIVNPTLEEVTKYMNKMENYTKIVSALMERYRRIPSVTLDGRKVEVAANAASLEDIDLALSYGAEGIGLLRTEFLFMNRDSLPDEEELFQAFKVAAQKVGDKPLIIRTLDIGGDKPLPYLKIPEESNPFLGWRGIRLCLDNVELFRIQLRAILRASVYGNVHVMFPMISDLSEVIRAKRLLREVMEELSKENIPFNREMKVGIMIETPSAAVISDLLAKEVDFFSIGTNDLTQYTLAVDRTNEKVADLYDHLHPAILRLVKITIENAHREGIWVGMCGEMAGDPLAVPVLLGLGLDEFSVVPTSVPVVKRIVSSMRFKDAEALARKVLSLGTPREVRECVRKVVASVAPEVASEI